MGMSHCFQPEPLHQPGTEEPKPQLDPFLLLSMGSGWDLLLRAWVSLAIANSCSCFPNPRKGKQSVPGDFMHSQRGLLAKEFLEL